MSDAPTTEELLKKQQADEIAARSKETENKELIGHQGNKTTLVGKDQGTQKLVKIRALRAIDYKGIQLAPGDVREVPEELAKEFCDLKFGGGYDFGGERGNASATRETIIRAERV